ncbi:MAG: flagellin [Planctomycetes bacterium]|nr:flagellin [Planctomycetota bacterium]
MAFTINNSLSLTILNNLNQLSSELAISNLRLSTTKRVNRASDDPSGVIAISNYQSQIAEIDAATANGQRISSIISAADGAMVEIEALLDAIETKVIAAADAGATSDEKAAYQLEIDEAIKAIDTIVNTTSFNGTRLLDGTIGYTTAGVDAVKLKDVRINAANTTSGPVSIVVAVTSIAQKATMTYANGNLGSNTDFTLTGTKGSYSFSFTTATGVDAMVTAINAQTDNTGIVAVNNGGNMVLTSENYGDSETISVNVTLGSLAMVGSITSDSGVDPTVTVNGLAASESGFQIQYADSSGSMRFTVTESFGTAIGSTSFTISGDGANFQLNTSYSTKINVGLSGLHSATLGNDSLGRLSTLKSGGANDVDSGNSSQALAIAKAANGQVTYDRARFGAIQKYAVDATLNAFANTKLALKTALSNVEDVDLVTETANNVRLQTLMQVNVSILAAINSNTSTILSLLKLI